MAAASLSAIRGAGRQPSKARFAPEPTDVYATDTPNTRPARCLKKTPIARNVTRSRTAKGAANLSAARIALAPLSA